jgi:hypothetical protein
MSDEVLMDIQRTLGRIEQKADSTIAWMTKHSAQNETDIGKLTGDLKVLELDHARQRGALKVWGIVGSTLGAGIGYLIEKVTIGHHN